MWSSKCNATVTDQELKRHCNISLTLDAIYFEKKYIVFFSQLLSNKVILERIY